MTTIYIRANFNIKNILSQENTYFIVENDIFLPEGQYTLGKGSVIKFAGGSFKCFTWAILGLNGGQVIAAPYPIFLGVAVTGFSNSTVYAEWFKESPSQAPHEYINKALIAAQGCPVVLAHKEYNLTGTIVFPDSTPSTLIAYGSLIIDKDSDFYKGQENPAAIEIYTSNVSISVNSMTLSQIKPTKDVPYPPKIFGGTGIRISGEVSDVSVNVGNMTYLKRGIEILPGGVDALSNDALSGKIQYLNIDFQSINAVYGIYIDIFSHGDPEQNWLKRTTFHGGRLLGDYGLYIDDTNCPANFSNEHISELLFTNIGFEGIKQQSIHLRKASHLKFEFIRMAESQPDEGYWIDLQNVSFVSFSINGGLRVDKYNATGVCDNIIIKGAVLKTTNWTGTPFDAIVVDTLQIQRGTYTYPFLFKAAMCTVNPYQMTKLIEKDENTDKDNNILTLRQIQPDIIPAVEGEYGGLKVLPRMLEFKITSNTTIDLTGIQDFAPCIYLLSVELNADTEIGLTLKSSGAPFVRTSFTDNSGIFSYNDTNTRLTIKQNGIYQFMLLTEGGKWRSMVVPL